MTRARFPKAAFVALLPLTMLLAAPAVAQTVDEDPVPEPVSASIPAAPETQLSAVPTVTPHWSQQALADLLAAVDAARDEGLRPVDYRRDEIAAAVAAHRTGPEIDTLATDAARHLGHDYADGRIANRARFDWHIDHSPAALLTLDTDLAQAVEHGGVRAYLDQLLPQDPRYAALRDALKADAGGRDTARLAAIRASMERWRWMPRTLGPDYIWVNVPSYRLAYYDDGIATQTHDVVVGAPKTPTPMINANVGAIVVNPWWTLPPTVLAEGKRYSPAKGFITTKAGTKMVIRQKPGPDNALGRLKIDMPNPYAIYLHDTPAKAAFGRPMRALSHGCIRVKDIPDLANQIYTDGVDTALAGPETQTLQLEKSVPVYIVYFTAAVNDGQVVTYGDPYKQDGAILAALDGVSRPLAAKSAASGARHG
jgi:murein L,D-transpeptidase YcbB/YkuD